MAAVPDAEAEEAAGEHGALKDAEEEARGQQAGVVLHQALGDADEPEADAARAEPDARGEALEQHVGGDLEHDVGHEEDGQGRVVVEPGHAEVGLEPKGARVANVDAVQEGHEVDDDEEGDDVVVDPERQLAVRRVRRAAGHRGSGAGQGGAIVAAAGVKVFEACFEVWVFGGGGIPGGVRCCGWMGRLVSLRERERRGNGIPVFEPNMVVAAGGWNLDRGEPW